MEPFELHPGAKPGAQMGRKVKFEWLNQCSYCYLVYCCCKVAKRTFCKACHSVYNRATPWKSYCAQKEHPPKTLSDENSGNERVNALLTLTSFFALPIIRQYPNGAEEGRQNSTGLGSKDGQVATSVIWSRPFVPNNKESIAQDSQFSPKFLHIATVPHNQFSFFSPVFFSSPSWKTHHCYCESSKTPQFHPVINIKTHKSQC